MNRYDIQHLGVENGETWDQYLDGYQLEFDSEGEDQPKYSPIRRTSKLRETEEIQPIPRRSHERVRHRIKDKLQDEYILDYWDEYFCDDV
jgi:hypothetical protein